MAETFPASLEQLQERVRRRLLTAENGQVDHWTNERVRDALNGGQQEIANELQRAFETRYFTRKIEHLVPTNNVIKLPDDFRREVTFDRRIGTGADYHPVKIISPARHAEFRAFSFPRQEGELYPIDEVWCIVGNELQAQGSVEQTGSYRLTYVYRPRDLQAPEDVSDIPPEYHDALVFYGAWMMATDAGMAERASFNRKAYDEKMNGMKRTATQVALTQSHRVRNVRRWL